VLLLRLGRLVLDFSVDKKYLLAPKLVYGQKVFLLAIEPVYWRKVLPFPICGAILFWRESILVPEVANEVARVI